MSLYAFDGTWNKDEDDPNRDTNVVKFRDAYQSTAKPFYVSGPGTRAGFFGKLFGGSFGIGGKWRVTEAYEELCKRYMAGDSEVDIVGFSRGAAIALDFANRIRKKGVRDPQSGKVIKAKPQIRFLGLWDTVAAFGPAMNVGPLLFHDWNPGWKLKVPDNVGHCYHALAIDDRRENFYPTRNAQAYEVWFRGYHSDVGGGKDNKVERSAIALRWMLRKAAACGLPLNPAAVASADALANPNAPLKKPKDIIKDRPRKMGRDDRYHYTVDQCTIPTDSDIEIPVSAPRETLSGEAQA